MYSAGNVGIYSVWLHFVGFHLVVIVLFKICALKKVITKHLSFFVLLVKLINTLSELAASSIYQDICKKKKKKNWGIRCCFGSCIGSL